MQPIQRIDDEIGDVLATLRYLQDQVAKQRYRLDTLRRLKLYAWSRQRSDTLNAPINESKDEQNQGGK